MDFILMIGMLAMGILALSRGKISLSKDKVLTGAPARTIAWILMAPLPLTLGISFLYGSMIAGQTPPRPLPDWVGFLGFETCALAAILAVVVGSRATRLVADAGTQSARTAHCHVCMRDYDKGESTINPKPCPTCGRFM